MAARHPNFPKKISELNTATRLAKQVIAAAHKDKYANLGLSSQTLANLKPLLKNPNYLCQSHNEIQGHLSDDPYNLILEATLTYNLRPLQQAVNHLQPHFNNLLNQVTTPLSEELKSILVDTSLPRTLGQLDHAHWSELTIGSFTKETLNPAIPSLMYFEAVLEGDLVRLDYSSLLVPLLSDPTVPLYLPDSENFKDHVGIPLVTFDTNKSFHQDFFWTVNQEDTNLSFTLNLDFSPYP